MSPKTGTVLRFFVPPKSSFFLFGPRGTGKSTLLQQHYRDAIWINLLNAETLYRYQTHPQHLQELLEGAGGRAVVVIDEIQKIPPLLDVVHALIESKTRHRFVMTGSSARKLKRSGTNLLAGRAVVRELHPFIASELGEAFQLSKALQHGLVPLVWQSDDPLDALKAYVAVYVREEVQSEGLVRRIAHFGRFLEAVSFSHASLINLATLAEECGVDAKTAGNYLSILRDLLIAYELPIFSKRAKRELIKHSKFYFFDAGVFRAIRPKGPLDHPNEIDGHALEGLVAQHLRAWIAYSDNDTTLSFWRTRSGNEVDFVLYGSKVFCGIEVKNSSQVRSKDLQSLHTFLEDYPEAKAILLYRGSEKIKRGQVLCWPCEDFLRELKPGKAFIA